MKVKGEGTACDGGAQRPPQRAGGEVLKEGAKGRKGMRLLGTWLAFSADGREDNVAGVSGGGREDVRWRAERPDCECP